MNAPAHQRNDLKPWTRWLAANGISATTGWRWRQRGWISTVNIGGRLYVTADAVDEFRRRAADGDFAAHVSTRPKPTGASAK